MRAAMPTEVIIAIVASAILVLSVVLSVIFWRKGKCRRTRYSHDITKDGSDRDGEILAVVSPVVMSNSSYPPKGHLLNVTFRNEELFNNQQGNNLPRTISLSRHPSSFTSTSTATTSPFFRIHSFQQPRRSSSSNFRTTSFMSNRSVPTSDLKIIKTSRNSIRSGPERASLQLKNDDPLLAWRQGMMAAAAMSNGGSSGGIPSISAHVDRNVIISRSQSERVPPRPSAMNSNNNNNVGAPGSASWIDMDPHRHPFQPRLLGTPPYVLNGRPDPPSYQIALALQRLRNSVR